MSDEALMNRRSFAAIVASLGGTSAAMKGALAQVTTPVGSTPTDLADLTQSEAMYAGILATWYDMTIDSLDRASALGSEPEPSSDRWVRSFTIEVSLWAALYEDARRFDAPDIFVDAHEYLVDSFESLDRASFLIAESLLAFDVAGIDEASIYIKEATESVGLYRSSLPFTLPNRSRVAQ